MKQLSKTEWCPSPLCSCLTVRGWPKLLSSIERCPSRWDVRREGFACTTNETIVRKGRCRCSSIVEHLPLFPAVHRNFFWSDRVMFAGPYLKFTWRGIPLNLIFAHFRATKFRFSDSLFFTGVLFLVRDLAKIYPLALNALLYYRISITLSWSKIYVKENNNCSFE